MQRDKLLFANHAGKTGGVSLGFSNKLSRYGARICRNGSLRSFTYEIDVVLASPLFYPLPGCLPHHLTQFGVTLITCISGDNAGGWKGGDF